MKDLEGKRLNELEARATFQEDTIEKLSKELSIQQKEIILLKEEIKSLKESFEKNIIEDTTEKKALQDAGEDNETKSLGDYWNEFLSYFS